MFGCFFQPATATTHRIHKPGMYTLQICHADISMDPFVHVIWITEGSYVFFEGAIYLDPGSRETSEMAYPGGYPSGRSSISTGSCGPSGSQ